MGELGVVLEVECQRCGGEGEYRPDWAPHRYYTCRCEECEGLGTVLTPLGEKVMACVLRRLRIAAKVELRNG
jgi:hypothetical protein